MDTGVLRDFVISITGGLFLFLLILVVILGFLLYRQIRALTASIKGTIRTTKEIGSEFKEEAKAIKGLVNLFKTQGKKDENNPPSTS